MSLVLTLCAGLIACLLIPARAHKRLQSPLASLKPPLPHSHKDTWGHTAGVFLGIHPPPPCSPLRCRFRALGEGGRWKQTGAAARPASQAPASVCITLGRAPQRWHAGGPTMVPTCNPRGRGHVTTSTASRGRRFPHTTKAKHKETQALSPKPCRQPHRTPPMPSSPLDALL